MTQARGLGGLGRGLSSLIPPKQNRFAVQEQIAASDPALREATTASIIDIPLSQIDSNPMQPRQQFDPRTLNELADSIRTYGLLEPIVVTRVGDRYHIVAGERRFRAHKQLGKQAIQSIIRSTSELERLELALIENIQREDLNPMEKAQGYAKLVNDFGITQTEAAKKLGIARPTLANTLRLLDLPTEVQVGLAEGRITEGHAKVLLGLRTPQEQLRLYEQMTKGSAMTVRDLNEAAQRTGSTKKPRSMADVELISLADRLQRTLGTKVSIQRAKGEKKRIVIETYSNEEFKQVLKKISRRA